MKLVFFGTPQFAVPSLTTLMQHPSFTVCGVVTQPDKRRGRGNRLSPSPVKTVAVEYHLPLWQPKRLRKDTQALADLAALQADAFVVVAYGQLLSPQVLAMPRLGCINGHGSLLPRYRGAAPIQWSLVHGDEATGITTMLMDEGMDTGPMLLTAQTPVAWWETAATVGDRLSQITADLLVETLQHLEAGTLTPTPQDPAQATYAPLIQKEDYRLDWSRDAMALHHQIRGFFPNSVTTLQGQPLKILRTVPLPLPGTDLPDAWADLPKALQGRSPQTPSVAPGQVSGILKKFGPIVQTGAGELVLCEVQPAGKKPQSGWDFANGARVQVGDQLGAPI
jgi:methionyl-tRNA formyltransferase